VSVECHEIAKDKFERRRRKLGKASDKGRTTMR